MNRSTTTKLFSLFAVAAFLCAGIASADLTDPTKKSAGDAKGPKAGITAHLGNASLLRGLSTARTVLKLNVFVHTKHAEAFNKLLADYNPDSAVSLMQVTELSPETAIRISDRVRLGEFVVIAGDPSRALLLSFGSYALFPPLAWLVRRLRRLRRRERA